MGKILGKKKEKLAGWLTEIPKVSAWSVEFSWNLAGILFFWIIFAYFPAYLVG